MKDITSTTFGLLIAYLLPGVVGLHALARILKDLEKLIDSFLSASSNIGLFFYVVLIALIIGLQLSAFRWVIYEVLLLRAVKWLFPSLGLQSDPGSLGILKEDVRLAAFRAAVDELYRYHQFWGGLSISLLTWIIVMPRPANISAFWWVTAVVIVEGVTVMAAIASYDRYIRRSREILSS